MKQQLFTIILFLSTIANAQNPVISLDEFSSGYSSPVDIENCGDNRLFIVEQAGKIWISDAAGNKGATPFLDISSKVQYDGAEEGLLGLAFHPDYKDNGYFYVNYINHSNRTVIARFQVSANDSNRANKASQQILLTVKQPFSNHKGGCLKFGPDGYLYMGLGDGGSGGDPDNNGQNPKALLGKILRIDVDNGSPYAIPATNPFVSTPGYRKEIWNLGMRNPWRFSFDRLTGDLYIGDVGQDKWEEVDYQPAGDPGGENYGWRCYEGDHEYNTTGCGASTEYDFPISEYKHGTSCTVIGGFVYRGSLFPNMYGKYIYCDYCSGKFKMLYNNGAWQSVNLQDFSGFTYSSFGEDVNGELYVSSLGDGTIYHVTDSSEPFAGNFKISPPDNSGVMIVPNPGHEDFMIHYTSAEKGQIMLSIYDLAGKLMQKSNSIVNEGNNNVLLNTSLPAGEYLLMIQSNQQIIQKKLIVQ